MPEDMEVDEVEVAPPAKKSKEDSPTQSYELPWVSSNCSSSYNPINGCAH